MKLSHSRVETFVKCPYQFKLRYIDKLETLPADDPASPLILGHALHTGIEKNVEAAIEEYYSSYPVINDNHITEAIKLEYLIPKVKELLPVGIHEVKIEDDDFIGFIDLLVPVDGFETCDETGDVVFEPDTYDLYDFKYSNNINTYMESGQLHEYKYYFEKLNPTKRIRNLYFVFIPKCQLKIKYKNKTNPKDETIYEFRKRVLEDLSNKSIEIVEVDYNPNKVIEFLINGKHAIECSVYDKNPTRLCDWCEFKRYCERKDDLDMQLPSTERRTIEGSSYKKIWLYGLPFSGKTYLANKFETPLMLNTDGNFKQVDAPVIRIMDEVTTEGRITKRKYAWEVFQEAVEELEKKNNDFKTIVVDLLEDVYDACRIKVCVDNGWDHESDDSFKAYDIVRSEFLRTLKRLLNLDYNIILISHEDSSKDLTKRGGDKITAIKPNLQDKVALKVAGMVDMVVRVINNEGKRIISFKSDEVTFGGGRLNIEAKDISCEYEELMKIYGENPTAGKEVAKKVEEKLPERRPVEINDEGKLQYVETATAEPTNVETPEEPKKRVRKAREKVEELHENTQPEVTLGAVEEPTTTRRRRRRVEE